MPNNLPLLGQAATKARELMIEVELDGISRCFHLGSCDEIVPLVRPRKDKVSSMTMTTLAAVVVMAGVAAYVQTLTGFAFGLLMMGGIALTGAMYLPDAAVIVSVLTLSNAAQVLARGWRDIAWPEFKLLVLPSFAGLLVGYWLLDHLAAKSLDGVRIALGVVIIASSLQLLFKPHPLKARSSPTTFLLFGVVGGLMGGLFSTSGPPLVYHLYRQPFAHVTIRETLVAIFAVNAVARLTVVTLAGDLPGPNNWWALLCVPAVFVMTYVARRWPPSLSSVAIRRMAFVLLLLSGLALAIPVLLGVS